MNGVVLSIVIGYLLGSCPFGYWAGRLRGVDLREEGSGNTGGTTRCACWARRWVCR